MPRSAELQPNSSRPTHSHPPRPGFQGRSARPLRHTFENICHACYRQHANEAIVGYLDPLALLLLASLATFAWSAGQAGVLIEPLRAAVQAELATALGAEGSIERLSLGAGGLLLGNVLVRGASCCWAA